MTSHVAALSPPTATADRPLPSADEQAGLTDAMADAVGYLTRAFGTVSGLRGLAVESAWFAAHLAGYPMGLLRENIGVDAGRGHYRTDPLGPVQRGLIASDMQASGTPVLLVHGLMDNRSVFLAFRRELRGRGFGLVHAVNYGAFTQDVRAAGYELRQHVNRLREQTGAERIHIVGLSLGGLIARYYVQRLGGDASVHTLATLGTPHAGTYAAYLMPTPLIRQLTPGSELLAELAEPAAGCRTRFLAVWSELDQLVSPRRNARLSHPDLAVNTLCLPDAGHMSLSLDDRAVRWVADSLPVLEQSNAS